MKLLSTIFFLLLFSSCYFFGPSSSSRLKQAQAVKPIDVAIIPGLPLHKGAWDTLLKARILWSEFLIKKGYVTHVIYSGSAVYTPWVEGSSMALYAKALGIDSNRILIDTMAEHSTENLYYGYLLAKQKGYRTVAVATDPFQCFLLHKFAKKNFRETIYFLPIIYDSIASRTSFEYKIDTTVTKRNNFVPITIREDFKSRYKGARGKRIPR